MGRLTSSTDFMGNTARFAYDALGRLIRQYTPFERVGNTTHYAQTRYFYDRNSNLTRTESLVSLPGEAQIWAATENTFRHNRLMTSRTGGTDGILTSYTYDHAGNILTMQVGEAITRFAYDNHRGRLTTTTDALGQVESITYDANGLVLTRTDRNGTTFRNTHDGMGRLTRVDAVRGGRTESYRAYTFTATGSLRTETYGNHTITYTYDGQGRVVRRDETGGISARYTYNAANNLIQSFTYVNNSLYMHNVYTHDTAQRVNRVTSNNEEHVIYAFNANGNRTNRFFANGDLVAEYTFNLAGLPTSVVNRHRGNVVSRFDYVYYLDGNTHQVSEEVLQPDGTTTYRTTVYAYDLARRLVNEERQYDNLPISASNSLNHQMLPLSYLPPSTLQAVSETFEENQTTTRNSNHMDTRDFEYFASNFTVLASGIITTGNSNLPWRLYDNGTLVVDSGMIHWNISASPWAAYSSQITDIVFTGTITAGAQLRNLFAGLANVVTIEGLDYFDTANTTSMSHMFNGASSLTSIDISGWDTSNVTNMAWMFNNASSLTSVGDLSNWAGDGALTHMRGIFDGASSLTNLNLSGWDTSSVLDMQDLFRDTHALTSIEGLSEWNTESATNMASMFNRARSLETLDLSGWSTNNVIHMSHMFYGASSLTSVGDLSEWDTSSLMTIHRIFSGANSLISLNMTGWDTSRVENTYSLFRYTYALETLEGLCSWDTGSATMMASMFRDSASLRALDLSSWNTENVTHMGRMFDGAIALRELTLGDDFSAVGSLNLPPAPNNYPYLGTWRNVGTATTPPRHFSFTSAQLMNHYIGGAEGDTWVWEREAYPDVERLPIRQVITTYTFDNRNNRVSKTTTTTDIEDNVVVYTVTYVYDLNNRLLEKVRTGDEPSTTTFTYDSNGNQLTQTTDGDTKTLTYDAFNHLVRVERQGMIAVYAYRADGLRISKTVNGHTTTHVWDRGSIILELNGSGAVMNRFSRGVGHLIRSYHHGFYLFNARTDVVQRVDSDGNILHTYRYDAFGNQLNGDAVNTNPFRFAAEYYDFETGFIYLRARFYNPAIGRFISEDPYWTIFNMQSSTEAILQAGNLFVFVMNNPVMWIDPTGLWGFRVHFSYTQRWAIEAGFTPQQANTIAVANSGVDLVRETGPFWGFLPWLDYDRSWHVNTFETGDSRLAHSEYMLETAITQWNQAHTNHEVQMAALNQITGLSPESRAERILGIEMQFNAEINQALTYLGRGLHPLQDYFAHGNIPITGHDIGSGHDNISYNWSSIARIDVVPSGQSHGARFFETRTATTNFLNRFREATSNSSR